MSAYDSPQAFEQRLRVLLEQHADAASGHVRSRLTQARHAALSNTGVRRGAWRDARAGRHLWVPAAAVLAVATAGALLFTSHRAAQAPFVAAATPVTAQDVRLLTDRDGLAMLEGGGGQFYEWAAAQTRGAAASGAAADGSNENGG